MAQTGVPKTICHVMEDDNMSMKTILWDGFINQFWKTFQQEEN